MRKVAGPPRAGDAAVEGQMQWVSVYGAVAPFVFFRVASPHTAPNVSVSVLPLSGPSGIPTEYAGPNDHVPGRRDRAFQHRHSGRVQPRCLPGVPDAEALHHGIVRPWPDSRYLRRRTPPTAPAQSRTDPDWSSATSRARRRGARPLSRRSPPRSPRALRWSSKERKNVLDLRRTSAITSLETMQRLEAAAAAAQMAA